MDERLGEPCEGLKQGDVHVHGEIIAIPGKGGMRSQIQGEDDITRGKVSSGIPGSLKDNLLPVDHTPLHNNGDL